MTDDIASARITIAAPPEDVWRALTDPAAIREYYFGSIVETDWRPGSTITWVGEYDGTAYQDHGKILEVDPPRRLRHTHFSPLSGKPDLPENNHVLTYTLTPVEGGTAVQLDQDNNGSAEAAEHAAANWMTMLEGLKKVVEG